MGGFRAVFYKACRKDESHAQGRAKKKIGWDDIYELAYIKLRLKPWEFEELQPWQFTALLCGYENEQIEALKRTRLIMASMAGGDARHILPALFRFGKWIKWTKFPYKIPKEGYYMDKCPYNMKSQVIRWTFVHLACQIGWLGGQSSVY